MLEPLVGAGMTVDSVLDHLHQAFYDADPKSWGEGPLAERTHRAMMNQHAPARERTPEEIAAMEARKAELAERRRQRGLNK